MPIERDGVEPGAGPGGLPWTGELAVTGVPELVRLAERERATGVLHLDRGGRRGRLFLRAGRLVDAELGRRSGEDAFHALHRWRDGTFAFAGGPVERPARVDLAAADLLAEARAHEARWAQALAALPPAGRVFELDYVLLSERLAEIPDEVNSVLRLVDGRRTLGEVIEEADLDELTSTALVARLMSERVLRPAGGPQAGDDWFAAPSEGAAPAPSEPARPAPPRIVRFPPAAGRSGAPGARGPHPPPGLEPGAGREAPPPPEAGPAPAALPGQAPPELGPELEPQRAPGPRRVLLAAAAAAALALGGALAVRGTCARPPAPAAPPTSGAVSPPAAPALAAERPGPKRADRPRSDRRVDRKRPVSRAERARSPARAERPRVPTGPAAAAGPDAAGPDAAPDWLLNPGLDGGALPSYTDTPGEAALEDPGNRDEL